MVLLAGNLLGGWIPNLGRELFPCLLLLLVSLVGRVLLVLDFSTALDILLHSILLAFLGKGRRQLELAFEIGNHGNQALLVGRLGASDFARREVCKFGGGLSHQIFVHEVYSQIPIVIIILLLCNILLKVVVGDDEVSVKQLGD